MQNKSTNTKTISHHEELLNARLKMQGNDEHHLEVVCEKDGVTWINHSMATTIDMTWFALRDIPSPAILILGGVDRAEDQHKLKMLVKQKVIAIVCLGSTPWKYYNAFGESTKQIVWARSLEESVDYAKSISKENATTVLFSPSCPSYDAFDNYKNRGNSFRKIVLEKIKKGKK